MIRAVPQWFRHARRLSRWPVAALLFVCFCLPAWSTASAAPLTPQLAPQPAPQLTAQPASQMAPQPTAQPTPLVLKSDEQSLWVDGLKSIAIGSLALIAAAASLFWLRRKYGAHIGVESAKFAPLLKSSRRVSQKTLLLVVQWEGRIYLLAEHGQTTELLDSRALDNPVAGSAAV